MHRSLMAVAATMAPFFAFAHPGHGAPDLVHAHATDVFGYVLLAVVAAASAWFARRK